MKKKMMKVLLAGALSASMLAGFVSNAEEGTDLSELTFGPFEWPVEPSIDYTQSWAKRFDGLEFTRIINDGGADPGEGLTEDDNSVVWGFETATGMVPKTLWTASGDAFTQKQNQAIASGEIPDLMRVGISQYNMLVKSGLIADLTDELKNGEHPTLEKLYGAGDNIALDTLEVDGRIYGIPKVGAQFDGSPLIWIRKDWMEKLNLEEPKTLKDLEAIAKAFMESDPDGNGTDDTYGFPIYPSFSASYGGDGNLCDIFLNVGGAAPGLWQQEEDGTVIYGSLMEGAKDALTFLNNWYEQGIIPSDFATWDYDTYKQVIGDGKAGIALAPWWGVWSVLGNSIAVDENAEWSAYMLPLEEGEQVRSAAGDPVSEIFVISNEFEDPSAFVYAYDLWNGGGGTYSTYDTYVEANNTYNPMHTSCSPKQYVIAGETFKKMASGELATLEEASDYFTEIAGVSMLGNIKNMFIGKTVYDAIAAGEENPRTVAAEGLDPLTTYQYYMQWAVGPVTLADADPIAVSTVYQGVTESMEMYNSFLETLEKEAYINMIMGNTDGQSISDYFDAFVNSYLEQGGAEITAEVQESIGK